MPGERQGPSPVQVKHGLWWPGSAEQSLAGPSGPHVAVRERALRGPHVAVRGRALRGPHMAVRRTASRQILAPRG